MGIVAPKENTFNTQFLTNALQDKVDEANRVMDVEQRSCIDEIATKIEFGMGSYYIFLPLCFRTYLTEIDAKGAEVKGRGSTKQRLQIINEGITSNKRMYKTAGETIIEKMEEVITRTAAMLKVNS